MSEKQIFFHCFSKRLDAGLAGAHPTTCISENSLLLRWHDSLLLQNGPMKRLMGAILATEGDFSNRYFVICLYSDSSTILLNRSSLLCSSIVTVLDNITSSPVATVTFGSNDEPMCPLLPRATITTVIRVISLEPFATKDHSSDLLISLISLAQSGTDPHKNLLRITQIETVAMDSPEILDYSWTLSSSFCRVYSIDISILYMPNFII
jgi:hypothetical protein